MRCVVAVLGMVLLVAGCTSEPEPAKPYVPVKHPPAALVADRDETAVLDTLAGLDPCKLLDLGDDAYLRRPHLCIGHDDGSSVHVEIGTRSTRAARFHKPAKEVGGAKVDAISDTAGGTCQAEIPVSFGYAVRISVLRGPGTPGCFAVDGYAAKVVAKLATPGKVRHETDRPDLSKDACVVLTGAPVASASRDTRSVLDECAAKTAVGGVRFGMLIEPGPPEGGWGTKWATVAGKTVYVGEDGCRWTWSQGQYSGKDNRLMTVSMSGCDGKVDAKKMKALLAGIIGRLAEPPVAGRVEHLTYRADEPDEPNPGACVDYVDDDCQPYQPTPVPSGTAQASEAASLDPHVACAASVDAVHAKFPDLTPVATQRGCAYVRPDRSLQLDVEAQGGPIAQGDQPTTTRKLTIAGHQADYSEYRAEKTPPRTSVCLDTGKTDEKTSQNWTWCLTATSYPPRAEPNTKADPTTPAPALTPTLTALATHFLT